MCLILIKPENTSVPYKMLRDIWDSNPDGAGMLWLVKDKVKLVKGLMTLKDLHNELVKLKEMEVAVHFRYATHGAVNRAMTHPFVCNGLTEEKLRFTTQHKVLMHNGTVKPFGSSVESDSFQLAKDVLSHVSDSSAIKLLEALDSSKFVLASPEIGIALIGKFIKHRGFLMSNNYWDMTTAKLPKAYYDAHLEDDAGIPQFKLWGSSFDDGDDTEWN